LVLIRMLPKMAMVVFLDVIVCKEAILS